LQRRPASAGSNEIEPGDERRAGADSDDRASEQRELEAAAREQHGVAGDRGDDRDESDALGAEAIGPAARGELHCEVRDEERGRQEPDRRE
jgi:hypothetical protein